MSSSPKPPLQYESSKVAPEVLCFGMITLARALVVDSLPDWNTGAVWTDGAEFVSDDAAIVAGLLATWGARTELAGTALGDDDAGRRAVRMLREMGVGGRFDLRDGIETPFEVNVSDRARGGRTYLWNRRPDILATLDDADLSALAVAKLLYVDWYDAPYIERAMKAARSLGVPVMLNLEHGHSSPETLDALLPYTTICQAVTDAAQLDCGVADAAGVARLLADRGVETALVTLASGGVVGAEGGYTLHVAAPPTRVVDACGAGATFSAMYIASRLARRGFERSLRFAVAAASLKCSVVGPTAFPLSDIRALADTLETRRLA